MGVKVTNNAFGTISAGISTSDTTITLDSGQGARFPTLGASDHFFGTLIDTSNNIEIVKVTARSTDSMTVTRGQDNTAARAFAIGDRFELRPTAALFEAITSEANTYADSAASLSSLGISNHDDLTVDSSGNLGVGQTTPTGKLHVAGGPIKLDNNYLIAPYMVPSSDYTTNGTYGFWQYNNQSVGVSFPSNNSWTDIISQSFTIASSTGVSSWNVHAHATWTGNQGGHRLWGALGLDNYNNRTGSQNTDGWHESSWYESDLSVAAYTWEPVAAWTNVSAGSHTIKLGAYANHTGSTCWRAGVTIWWYPSDG